VFEEGAAIGGRREWGNNEANPIVKILQQKPLQTATYAVNKDELSKSLSFST